ncbi:hypothetical protein CPC16_010443 [Podila verticillata]|nr:hypothetical protein BGZ52_002565 [Haplosporangium bisporale]KAF9380174.1 hypothetical protein CPC16_010443 [Podila verticillata]KAI9232763.1 MAG: hypothetical protein BYD32DRAFT_465952 [Podila humilis]
MKFSLKAVALSALLASAAVGAPVGVEKRDSNSDRIAACFVGLIFTGAWPSSCKAAVAVDLGLIKTITINQMSMDFTPANPWAPTTSSNNIVATMISIPGITLPIDSVQQNIIITDNGVQLGSIGTPWSAASVNGGTMTTSFTTSALNVFPNAQSAFSQFISALSTSTSHITTLQGSVDAKLNLGIFGHLTIPGIGFKVNTPFQGLNNLNGMKFMILIDTNFDTPGKIIMATIINLKNPSNLSLKLGDVSFSTAAAGGYVGISTIKNLSLVPGDNFVMSITALDTSLGPTNDFLNGLYNADQTLVLTGFSGTSSDAALNAGLAALKSNLVVPMNFVGASLSQVPYKNWSLKVLPTTATDGLVEVTGTFQSGYYGYSLQMLQDEPAGQDNYAFITGVSLGTENMRLFDFNNTLSFTTSGSSSTTVTFKVPFIKFVKSDASRVQELVTFASAKGYVSINLWWIANVVVGGDGITRQVDLGNSGTNAGVMNVAVGSDFASIVNLVPSA